MFCESYREALSEAALSDDRLPAEVQAHLESCASCRAAFSDEQALFALIDAEVRARVNAEAPASLLPRVRQEIASPSPAARTWRVPILACVASGLAVAVLALSFAVRTNVLSVKSEPSAHNVPLPVPDEPSLSQKGGGSAVIPVATIKRSHKQPQVALRAEPEVLVSAEEQLGLQRYTASLKNKKAGASGVIKDNAVAEIEPLEIAKVEVKQLSIQPLESGDAN